MEARGESIQLQHPLLHLTFQGTCISSRAVKLLAPAILLGSLVSIPPVVHEEKWVSKGRC